ncbi:unnamed protein product [Ranitomeya imitator]|uniref:Uncharacterized protein n=1 Tax=Ranitomeya imitator TaxID=111125 RepID=A0ABN9MII0_9NEOB|nr:unnamed protein product [Ranitomeya imitator]
MNQMGYITNIALDGGKEDLYKNKDYYYYYYYYYYSKTNISNDTRGLLENEPSTINTLTPFLRYLFCEPSQLQELCALRMGIRKALLHSHPSTCKAESPSAAEEQVVRLLFDLISFMQLTDCAQVTEVTMYMKDLCVKFCDHPDVWRNELHLLSLQALCACDYSLKITGDCSTLLHIVEESLDLQKESIPREQILTGLSLLLLNSPCNHHDQILHLAKTSLNRRHTRRFSDVSRKSRDEIKCWTFCSDQRHHSRILIAAVCQTERYR